MNRPRLSVLLVSTAALIVSACGARDDGAPSEPGDSFIALQRDFEGFESWESFTLEVTDQAPTHVPGPRTIYLRERPPSDATSFPNGTLIVKITQAPEGEQFFAMAKRGGGFNQSGATGWEWFELARSTQGVPVIVWRGVGPPAGHRYGQVDASCNDCHKGATANDFVMTTRLSLSDL